MKLFFNYLLLVLISVVEEVKFGFPIRVTVNVIRPVKFVSTYVVVIVNPKNSFLIN